MMGTTYYAVCKDCNVKRDLDKFYSMRVVENRKEAIELWKSIEKCDSFRAGLLVSFMWEHRGHNCTVATEHEDYVFDVPDEKINYWSVEEGGGDE